ncbi:rubrerythrin-like domain-containing protein [Halorientalis sp. IM1011]|uniref:rubrerythrin-like domain-containing protein n=1 Tax=Halorientalis sp. IM1011 TaxID=1932360 RepID=UPI0012F9F5AD|nr:rubrerythrin-like domain-containing protein [Halorientalis sp. IM1011]
MPTPTDPAPCGDGEDLYECRDCGARRWTEDRLTSCPDCDGRVENLTKPRPE